MQVIPVIDLKQGRAVHAHHGDRAHYRPIRSPLCRDSSPEAVVRAYLGVYPFSAIYIADLDALTGTGHHREVIDELCERYPGIAFWVDAGIDGLTGEKALFGNWLPVIGTESLQETDLAALKALNDDWILSLDFTEDRPLGPNTLFRENALWPAKIILMTLKQVGGNQGPDFQKLQQYRSRYPEQDFIAAGGIRHRQDLIQLRQNGIRHALIASALHAQTIRACDIESVR